MTDRKAAEVFAPGEFIKEELEARDWRQAELAEIMGRPPTVVSGLVKGTRAISPEIAKALGDAFGTSAHYWMNLESIYRLQRAGNADNVIARRARLYEKAPIKEIGIASMGMMVVRQWRRKMKITKSTRRNAISSVSTTSDMALRMFWVVSMATVTLISSGRSFLICSRRA